jgi:catechol 2,3-dioxygenase-like lactoylglutathione lyase family enzyme
MSLASLETVAFIPSTNFAAARTFYQDTLGLTFVKEDGHAIVFSLGPHHQMLRIAKAPGFTPLPFTQFGWEVDDLHATIADLKTRGVEFLRIGIFEQDPAGVWTAPDGSQVAWFKDPDGNTLSLSTHPA